MLQESDAPGSEPDPVETRVSFTGTDDFMASEAATRFESSALEAAGFVAAIDDLRFYPEEPGGRHTRSAPHARLLVLEFESDEGAREGAEMFVDSALEPCPGTCALRISEFEVSDVPDASGVRRFVSAEALAETGDPGEPHDSYTVVSADGEFAYELEVFGPPGEFTQKQAEEMAAKVHDRVGGAPAPES